jgi:hypothetical protein
MKKLNEGHRPRFFFLSVQGYDQEVPPELQALAQEFARQMVDEYNERRQGCYDLLKRYPDDEGLKQLWTPEKIESFANGDDNPQAIEKIRSKPFEEISWRDVQEAVAQDMTQTSLAMKAIYDGAEEYIAGGLYAASAIGYMKPFKRMQFTVIRNAFIEEWKPRGGIEAGMVDMLAQCYVVWQFWLTQSFDVANHIDDAAEQVKKSKSPYEAGVWNPPRLTAAEYLERATQMADRFQRMFLRTLRQMRDLRRYVSPVIVQNAGQVNIAADGGQQVNVQQSKKKSPSRRIKSI